MDITLGSYCREIIPLSDGQRAGLTGRQLLEALDRCNLYGYKQQLVDMSGCAYGGGTFTLSLRWNTDRYGYVLAVPFGIVRNLAGARHGDQIWLSRSEPPRCLPFIDGSTLYDSLVLCDADLASILDASQSRLSASRVPPRRDTCASQGRRLAEHIALALIEYIDHGHALPV